MFLRTALKCIDVFPPALLLNSPLSNARRHRKFIGIKTGFCFFLGDCFSASRANKNCPSVNLKKLRKHCLENFCLLILPKKSLLVQILARGTLGLPYSTHFRLCTVCETNCLDKFRFGILSSCNLVCSLIIFTGEFFNS